MDPTTPDLAGHDHRRRARADRHQPPADRLLPGRPRRVGRRHPAAWWSGNWAGTSGTRRPPPGRSARCRRSSASRPRNPASRRPPRSTSAELRRRERAELESSGWVDEKARTVRIPIDEAMRVIAERGLPARKSQEGADADAQPKNPDAR